MREGMRTPYVEVLAAHDGPESCVGDPRKGAAKRWQGYVQAGPVSREINSIGVPTPSQ
jgi:hypothetical protein